MSKNENVNEGFGASLGSLSLLIIDVHEFVIL
jgi:hypothetical protein